MPDTSTITNAPPELLTLALVRKHYLPLAARTVFRMISTGAFPEADIKIGGKIRLWRRETVEQWMKLAEGKRGGR